MPARDTTGIWVSNGEFRATRVFCGHGWSMEGGACPFLHLVVAATKSCANLLSLNTNLVKCQMAFMSPSHLLVVTLGSQRPLHTQRPQTLTQTSDWSQFMRGSGRSLGRWSDCWPGVDQWWGHQTLFPTGGTTGVRNCRNWSRVTVLAKMRPVIGCGRCVHACLVWRWRLFCSPRCVDGIISWTESRFQCNWSFSLIWTHWSFKLQ